MSQLGIAFRIKGLEGNSRSHSSYSHKKDNPSSPANNVTSWSLSDKITEDNTLIIPVQPDICLHLKREREIEEKALEKEAVRAILRETESQPIQEDAITVSTYYNIIGWRNNTSNVSDPSLFWTRCVYRLFEFNNQSTSHLDYYLGLPKISHVSTRV